jgi:hypothetical protein
LGTAGLNGWAAALPLLAAKLAAPCGVTQHEYDTLGVGPALAAWLQREQQPAARAAFLDAFLVGPEGGRGLAWRRSALVSVVRRAQGVVERAEALSVFKHRNPNDILETTSKAMDLHLFFKDAPHSSSNDDDAYSDDDGGGGGDDGGGGDAAASGTSALPAVLPLVQPALPPLVAVPPAEHCVVKATRTSHVGALEAHVLRALPAAALPEPYRAACRHLVGALVRERAALQPSSVQGAGRAKLPRGSRCDAGGGGAGAWRACVVLAYDEAAGAHRVSYAAAQALRARGEKASPAGRSRGSAVAVAAFARGPHYEGCWLRLSLRDVQVLERVGPPQPPPDPAAREAAQSAAAAARKASRAEAKRAAAKAAADAARAEVDAAAAAVAAGLPLVARVEVSGHGGRHGRFNGVYEEERGRSVHGAKVFRMAGGSAPNSSKFVMFRSSGTGKWVITDTEANFVSNQGFLRCKADASSGLPTSPGEQFPGSGSDDDWVLDPNMCVATTQRAAPDSPGSSPHPPIQWHRGVHGENAELRGPVALRSNSYGDATVFTGLPLPSAPAPPPPPLPRGGRHAQHHPQPPRDARDEGPSHVLEECRVDNGWRCDGAPRCLGRGGGRGESRFRCTVPGCDFDLCLPCWEHGADEDGGGGAAAQNRPATGGGGGGAAASLSGDGECVAAVEAGAAAADAAAASPTAEATPAVEAAAAVDESASAPATEDGAAAVVADAAPAAGAASAAAAAAAPRPATARSFTVEVETFGSSYSGTLRVGLTTADPTTFAGAVPAMLGALGETTYFLSGRAVSGSSGNPLAHVPVEASFFLLFLLRENRNLREGLF